MTQRVRLHFDHSRLLIGSFLAFTLVLLSGFFGISTAHADSSISLQRLQVEKKAEPVGIDLEQPRFSWVISSSERGLSQESYRIQVAATETALQNNPHWDSGTVTSPESSNVAYDGPALAPSTEYFWRVEVETSAGSANAQSHFRTGFYDESDWQNAKWIGNARAVSDDDELTFKESEWIWTEEVDPPNSSGDDRAFRFVYDSPSGLQAETAEVLITADDSYRLWVNGTYISETDGRENGWQQSHLHTVPLEADQNTFAVQTTNDDGTPAGLIAAIRFTFDDGSREVATTGSDWLASKTVEDGFETVDFDDANWEPASVIAIYGSGPWGGQVNAPAETPPPAPLLRKEFDVTSEVRSATLLLTAGGYADVTINGEDISDELLAPGFADYDKTVQYIARDVTPLVQEGSNAIGMELGRGFYGMTGANVWWWERAPWHDEPVVKAVLDIEHADGSRSYIVTDDSWHISDGPTIFDDLYAGETFDASLVQDGYSVPGFDAAGWARASVVSGPEGELINQRQQPIRITEELPAQEITEPEPGTYVVKFPRMLAGNVQVSVQGEKGDTVRMQYGEKLRSNGLPNFDNNGGFQSGFQTDRFILAGTGVAETWSAKFSYKGFQYIQVDNWPDPKGPTVENFTAQAIHSDTAETGQFETSSELLNSIHRATVDTLLNNLHGIPTDTPMFEKNGWTGDASVGTEMFLLNLDSHELFAKWMRDVNDTRDEEGAPLVIAPSSSDWGAWGVAPTWHSAYVFIPWWLYQYGNDPQVLSDYYDGLKKYVDLEYDRSPNGIADTRLADWVSPEASPAGGNAPEDTKVSATAYLYEMLVSMERSARFLGKDAEAATFAQRAEVVKQAFNEAFYDADAGYYKGISGDHGYRQTHNALALAFGLTPDEEIAEKVAESIVADVRDKGTTLNTGVLGTKFLLPVLTDHGYPEVAYELALQTDYPSWGYKIENGATSMWEHWSTDARSYGHYFLGTVEDWFYQYVLGIKPHEFEGYREITINPTVSDQISWARGSTETPFGTVGSEWKHTDGGIQVDVAVPVGTTANVHLPSSTQWNITEGDIAVADAEGVREVTAGDDEVIVTVGSGKYSFFVDPDTAEIGNLLDLVDHLAEVTEEAELESQTGAVIAQIRDLVQNTTPDSEGAHTLAPAVELLDELADIIAGADLDGDRVDDALSAVILETHKLITKFLDVVVTTSTNSSSYQPADDALVSLSVNNNGEETIRDLAWKVDGHGWSVDPESQDIAGVISPGASAVGSATVAVPSDADPSERKTHTLMTYDFNGHTIEVPQEVVLVIDSSVSITGIEFDPNPAHPGGSSIAKVTVTNHGEASTRGQVELTVPDGWVTPLPSTLFEVDGKNEATVSIPVFIPREADVEEHDVTITAGFVRNDVRLYERDGTLQVAIDESLIESAYDHIDLGDDESEQEHNLTAHEDSGTSVEAGKTRRYTGHLTPGSWFEFDVQVVEGEPFVLRAVETYDRAQTKLYKVYIDGEEVFLRQNTHTGGEDTETYEHIVPAEYVTSDNVRVKFEHQDDPAFYDPSIADVWVLPVTADETPPQVEGELSPSAVPSTGWFTEGPVEIILTAVDDTDSAPVIEHSLRGEWTTYEVPIELDEDGEHIVTFRATDAAGNTSPERSLTVRIDSTAPTVSHEWDDRDLTLSASDDTSGVALIEYRLDDDAWVEYDEPFTVPSGIDTVHGRAQDNAGNVSEVIVVEVPEESHPEPGPDPDPTPDQDPTPDPDPSTPSSPEDADSSTDPGSSTDDDAQDRNDKGSDMATTGTDAGPLVATVLALLFLGAAVLIVRAHQRQRQGQTLHH